MSNMELQTTSPQEEERLRKQWSELTFKHEEQTKKGETTATSAKQNMTMTFSDWKKYKEKLNQPRPPPPAGTPKRQQYTIAYHEHPSSQRHYTNNNYGQNQRSDFINNHAEPIPQLMNMNTMAPWPQFHFQPNNHNTKPMRQSMPPQKTHKATKGIPVLKPPMPPPAELLPPESKSSTESSFSGTQGTGGFQSNGGPKSSGNQPNQRNAAQSGQRQWIQKPAPPPPMNADTTESKEEKQRMWREYRQAMKPFKNREFMNAKRTIQRLGKRKMDELDEKERTRLQRAQETVSGHKIALSQKATIRWVRSQEQRESMNEQESFRTHAQIYVRQPNQSYNKPYQPNVANRGQQGAFSNQQCGMGSYAGNNFVKGGYLNFNSQMS